MGREAAVVIVMGVSGAGKTTIGRMLAHRLGWAFADADAYHTPDAKAKMARGEGLTDADRDPWLDGLAQLVQAHVERGKPLVLACSALKHAYRARLAGGSAAVRFVWLDAPPEELRARLDQRAGHFAGSSLLASQLDALERPDPRDPAVDRVDATLPEESLLTVIVRTLLTQE